LLKTSQNPSERDDKDKLKFAKKVSNLMIEYGLVSKSLKESMRQFVQSKDEKSSSPLKILSIPIPTQFLTSDDSKNIIISITDEGDDVGTVQEELITSGMMEFLPDKNIIEFSKIESLPESAEVEEEMQGNSATTATTIIALSSTANTNIDPVNSTSRSTRNRGINEIE